MKIAILVIQFFAFSNLFAATYYVAPYGSDNNPGTITLPWKTWQKAFVGRLPGDIVYFRGGVYPMTVLDGTGYSATIRGTATDSIFFLNFPGERPVLDCSTVSKIRGENHNALSLNLKYVKIRGLTICNVWQFTPSDEVQVWCIGGGYSVIQNCTVYNSHGRGFFTDSCNELYLINCDAYNHCDSLTSELPGNDGYGFFIQDMVSTTNRVYLKGCRAWRCGDDGFTCYSRAYVEFSNCWSFYNGAMEGEGHGFKLGWQEIETNSVRRVIKNCIATWNLGHGFTTNEKNDLTSLMQVYNNTSYHNLEQPYWGYNSVGFIVFNTSTSNDQELGREFKNNLSYRDAGGPVYIGDGALYTHSNNSWDLPVTINDADFVSLDTTGLSGARIGNEGRLPDMKGFLELAEGSDLIDKGVFVGMLYIDAAPDLGFSEFSNKIPPVPVTSINITFEGDSPTITSPNGTLQLHTMVLPQNANTQSINWSITDGRDKAFINPEGLVIAVKNGIIEVMATADDGSGTSAVITISIENQVTGIVDAGYSDSVAINYVPGGFAIIQDKIFFNRVYLYDMSGRLTRNLEITQSDFRIDTSGMLPGMYFLILSSRKIRKALKILIP